MHLHMPYWPRLYFVVSKKHVLTMTMLVGTQAFLPLSRFIFASTVVRVIHESMQNKKKEEEEKGRRENG